MQSIESKYRKLVLVCTNAKDGGRECCGAKGSDALFVALKQALKEADPTVRVSKTGCLGRCETGPTVVVMPDDRWFGGAGLGDVPAIVDLVLDGRP